MTQGIRVAPLQASHRSVVETIVRATGVFSEEEIGVAIELFDETFVVEPGNVRVPRALPVSDYEFLGAFAADRLIGYACFGATPSTERTYDLYWIAVHPNEQGTGAGAALMTEVERRMKERCARLLVIETSSREDYAPTRRFYGKRGYEETARLRDFYARGDDRVVLARRF